MTALTKDSVQKSWRQTLPVHPAAELFPEMGQAAGMDGVLGRY
jgi:hypothetical protein